LLGDMEFLFSCSIRYLTRSLRSLVRYRVEHSKRNSISPRALVLLSIYPTVLVIVQKARESHDIVQLVIVQYRVTLVVFFQVTEKG